MNLAGKTAVVTGASGAIGRAIAGRLARGGANLVLGYWQDREGAAEVERSCAAAGALVVTARGDLGEASTAGALCELAVDRFGEVQILVNNAAAMVDGLLAVLPDEDIEQMVAVNIVGLVRLTRSFLRPMLRQRSGCIINISSALASRPGRGNAVYAGTKGFVESFTRALAEELGKKQVRVNAVAPGVIDGGMSRSLLAMAGETVRARIALRRFGQPEDVASLVAFLASDEAAYITGAVLPVDGAFSGGA